MNDTDLQHFDDRCDGSVRTFTFISHWLCRRVKLKPIGGIDLVVSTGRIIAVDSNFNIIVELDDGHIITQPAGEWCFENPGENR